MGLRLLTLTITLLPPKRHTYQYALLSEMVTEDQLGQAMYLQVALNNLKKSHSLVSFLDKSSYIVDYFMYLCVHIKEVCR